MCFYVQFCLSIFRGRKIKHQLLFDVNLIHWHLHPQRSIIWFCISQMFGHCSVEIYSDLYIKKSTFILNFSTVIELSKIDFEECITLDKMSSCFFLNLKHQTLLCIQWHFIVCAYAEVRESALHLRSPRKGDVIVFRVFEINTKTGIMAVL